MFEYTSPSDMKGLFAVLTEHGPAASLLAGGTDLFVNMRQKAIDPQIIVNLKGIPGLDGITMGEKDEVTLGPLVTLSQIAKSDLLVQRYEVLADAAERVSAKQLRNMGTVGGNICQLRKCYYYNQSHVDLFMRESIKPCLARGGSVCHAAGKDSLFHSVVGMKKCRASCCSDMLVALACCDAKILVSGPGGARAVSALDFWPGPEAGVTALDKAEIVSGIQLPVLAVGTRSIYLKYKRDPRDFPVTSVAARAAVDQAGTFSDVRVVLGGVAPLPWRAEEVERALNGSNFGESALRGAAALALRDCRSFGPATDFKIVKTRQLVRQALEALATGRDAGDAQVT